MLCILFCAEPLLPVLACMDLLRFQRFLDRRYFAGTHFEGFLAAEHRAGLILVIEYDKFSVRKERIFLQQIHQFFRIAGFVFFEQFSVEFRIEGSFKLHHIENQAG